MDYEAILESARRKAGRQRIRIPVDLFVHYLISAFFAVDLVDGPPWPPNTVANRGDISLFGAPDGTCRSWIEGIIKWEIRVPAESERHARRAHKH